MNYALITGASSGLGKALALALAEQSTPLILSGRNQKALEELRATLSVPCELHIGDLADDTAQRALLALIQEHAPSLLINNAGLGYYGPCWSLTQQEAFEVLDINVKALTALTLAAVQALLAKKKRGTILNISSAAAFLPHPWFATYAASKAYVNSFSRSLDFETKPHGIRVLTACPGQLSTPFRSRAAKTHPQQLSRWTLSPTTVARQLLRQVETGTSLQIFDWRYRLALFLTRLLPSALVLPLLENAIRCRCPQVIAAREDSES